MVDRAATALASADASLDIWANFIYYQSWVLSWLGKQIEPRYAYLFAQRAARLGGRFPAAALRQFKARYRDQTPNLIAVCLQCQQSGFLLWKYTSGHLAPNVRDACLHWGDLASDGPPEELWPKIGDGMEG
jgi:hypothetical protein